MPDLLATVEITTGPAPDAAVIWLHGLGADGHDFMPIVPEIDLPLAVRYVFPHAPVRPITLNGGMPMRAWFDLSRLDRPGSENLRDISESMAQVRALINREITRGIPSERIVLAGFSQGGAIALHAALANDAPLAGVLALSTWLPHADEIALRQTPHIFMAHGSHDPIVPLRAAQAARDWLKAHGCTVRWHEYPMPHSVCSEEIKDIREFLLAGLSRRAN